MRIFMTGKQNKLFLKVRIRATPLQNRGLPFTSSSSFYVHCFCCRQRHGYFPYGFIPHTHACAGVCIHPPPPSPHPLPLPLSPPPPFLSSSSYFLSFGLLVLAHCFRFLLAWNQPLMTQPAQVMVTLWLPKTYVYVLPFSVAPFLLSTLWQ